MEEFRQQVKGLPAAAEMRKFWQAVASPRDQAQRRKVVVALGLLAVASTLAGHVASHSRYESRRDGEHRWTSIWISRDYPLAALLFVGGGIGAASWAAVLARRFAQDPGRLGKAGLVTFWLVPGLFAAAAIWTDLQGYEEYRLLHDPPSAGCKECGLPRWETVTVFPGEVQPGDRNARPVQDGFLVERERLVAYGREHAMERKWPSATAEAAGFALALMGTLAAGVASLLVWAHGR